MKLSTCKDILGIAATAPAFVSAVRIFDEQATSFGAVTFHTLEWTGVFIACTLFAVYVWWNKIVIFADRVKSNSPKNKFKQLHQQIDECRAGICGTNDEYGNSDLVVRVASLKISLDKLKIDTPKKNDKIELWAFYLTNLQPLSEHGRLRDARRIMKIIRRGTFYSQKVDGSKRPRRKKRK